MLDVRSLRTQIESALSDLLGTYTFVNGRTTPAFGVIKGNEVYPPDGTTIKGLEAILFYPALDPMATLTGYRVKQKWTLHLKQWERGKSVNPACDRILANSEILVEQIIPMPAQERLGIPEGAQIKIRQFQQV